MPRPDPDAAPLWAWMRWIDSHDRVRSRPDRRCQDFRGQYDDFDLVHLRVDEHRVLLTLLTLTGIMPYSTMRRVNPSPRLMIGRLKNLTHGLMGIGMTRPRKNAGNGTTM